MPGCRELPTPTSRRRPDQTGPSLTVTNGLAPKKEDERQQEEVFHTRTHKPLGLDMQ